MTVLGSVESLWKLAILSLEHSISKGELQEELLKMYFSFLNSYVGFELRYC
jgi:hypothetical protein